MNKVVYRLFVVFCLVSTMLVALPFHIAHASGQALSAPFLGVNIYLIGRDGERYLSDAIITSSSLSGFRCSATVTSGNSTYCSLFSSSGSESYDITFDYQAFTTYTLYEYEFILDSDYIGSVTSPQFGTQYVNGSSFRWSTSTSTTNITISSYSLIRKQGDYLYDFPIESFTFIDYMMAQNFEISDVHGVYKYRYPVFKTDTSKSIINYSMSGNSNDEFILIIGMSNNYASNLSRFNTLFTYPSYLTFYDYDTLYVSGSYRISSVKFTNTDSSSQRAYLYYANNTDYIMPIYCNRTRETHISTDFALTFNLHNDLLDNISLIAQGTQQSDTSASDLENEQGDFSSSAADMYSYENTFNSDLNSNLNNINVNFDIGNTLGSKFLASADWVRAQFNYLTGNSPFGSILSFSLILGLALLLVGKLL